MATGLGEGKLISIDSMILTLVDSFLKKKNYGRAKKVFSLPHFWEFDQMSKHQSSFWKGFLVWLNNFQQPPTIMMFLNPKTYSWRLCIPWREKKCFCFEIKITYNSFYCFQFFSTKDKSLGKRVEALKNYHLFGIPLPWVFEMYFFEIIIEER